MAGITSFITIQDRFSGTLTKYKTLVKQCTHSSFALGKTIAVQSMKSDSFLSTMKSMSSATNAMAVQQDYLQSKMGLVDSVFGRIIGRGDAIGSILDTSIRILRITSLIFPPLRIVSNILERIRDYLDNGLGKLEFSQDKIHEIVNNLPQIAQKMEKALKALILSKVVINVIKNNIVTIGVVLVGVAASWALISKTQFGVMLQSNAILGNFISIGRVMLTDVGAGMGMLRGYGSSLSSIALQQYTQIKKVATVISMLIMNVSRYYWGIAKTKAMSLFGIDLSMVDRLIASVGILGGELLSIAKAKAMSVGAGAIGKIKGLYGTYASSASSAFGKAKGLVTDKGIPWLKRAWETSKAWVNAVIVPAMSKAFSDAKGWTKGTAIPWVQNAWAISLNWMKTTAIPKMIAMFNDAKLFATGFALPAMKGAAIWIKGTMVPQVSRAFGVIRNEASKTGQAYKDIFSKVLPKNLFTFLMFLKKLPSLFIKNFSSLDFYKRIGKEFVKYKNIFVLYMKQTGKSLAASLKGVFKESVAPIMKGALSAYMLYRSAKGFVNNLRKWQDRYRKLSEITDYLIDQTQSLERSVKRIATFGEEGAKAIGVYAREYAGMTGQAISDIEMVAQKMRRSNISGSNIVKFMGFADMFNKLNDDVSFTQAGEAIANAVFTGATDELENLLGGGEYVSRLVRRARISRLLRKGQVDEAMRRFMDIAKGMGYTQEALDKVNQSLPTKLKRTRSLLEGYATVVKDAFLKRVEPFVDELINLLTSEEFKGFFQQELKRILAIVDAFGLVARYVVKAGVALYKWWIEPNKGFMRLATMFVGIMMIVAKFKQVIALFAAGKGLFGILGKFFVAGKSIFSALFIKFLWPLLKTTGMFFVTVFKGIFVQSAAKAGAAATSLGAKILGGLTAIKASAITGIKAIGTALLTSPIVVIPTLLFAVFKGSQKIVSHLKGEATDAITSVIELFVGGIQYTSGKIWQASETFHNAFFDFVESIYNGILEFISPAIWAVMKAFQRFEMGALGLKQKFFEVMIAIRDIFFTIMEEFANSSIFGFIYGDDAVKAVRQQIAYFRAESDLLNLKLNGIKDMRQILAKKINSGDYEGEKKAIIDQFSIKLDSMHHYVLTDDDIQKATQSAINSALDNKVVGWLRKGFDFGRDLVGAGDINLKQWEEALKALENIGGDVNNLVQMGQKERDLRWMKEMAEQSFVNTVNLRQLTPTIKVEVNGSNASADDIANAINRELSEMAAKGTFNAYGEVG